MEEVKFRAIFLTKNALSFNAVIILNKNFKNVLVKKRDCE